MVNASEQWSCTQRNTDLLSSLSHKGLAARRWVTQVPFCEVRNGSQRKEPTGGATERSDPEQTVIRFVLESDRSNPSEP